MFDNSDQKQAAASLLMKSAEGLGTALAAVASFFSTPFIWKHTHGAVEAFATNQYGAGLASLAGFVWWALIAICCFFFFRMTVAVAVIGLATAIATRLFV